MMDSSPGTSLLVSKKAHKIMRFLGRENSTCGLELCGEKITDEEILEKTYSISHASNWLIKQQYHENDFKKNHELIPCLLVADQNNEILMKKLEACPNGCT